MQRIQRLQAERLDALASGGPNAPISSSEPSPALLASSATPSHEHPDPSVLRRLHWDRLSAKDGASMQIARTFIVTLMQPMIEKLLAEAKEHPEPYKSELVFWSSCLAAGVFPHAPAKLFDRELTAFETWFYSSIPSIDDGGRIQNWRTL